MKAIEVKKLTKEYPGKLVLDCLSFSVKKGTIHGFLGPNGAGKSTTMNIICGLVPATSGEVLLFSKPISNIKDSVLGFLPEKIPLYTDMRVKEYLDFVLKIFKGHDVQRIEKTIARCGLVDVQNQFIGTLSRGYQQRVGIAQAIVCDPPIVVLDEPTIGLDPNSIIEIRSLIKDLAKDHTFFISTHLLAEAELLCDELTLIDKGKLIVTGELASVKSNLSIFSTLEIKALCWKKLDINEFKNKFNIESHFIAEDTLSVELKADKKVMSEVLHYLSSLGFEIFSFIEKKVSLEEIFAKLTKRKN